MNQKGMLQDKMNQLKIQPSERVWNHIEKRLDVTQKAQTSHLRTIWGIAAAIVLVIIAYFIGAKTAVGPVYSPMTLEVSDQASEVLLPPDSYNLRALEDIHYRKDGRLIPNARALWDNPLVPRVN